MIPQRRSDRVAPEVFFWKAFQIYFNIFLKTLGAKIKSKLKKTE